MQYLKKRCPRKTQLLLLIIILLQSIPFSGCLSLLDDRPADPTDNAPVSSHKQQNQRPFQAEMDVPEYLDDSFEYDEAVICNGIDGSVKSSTPRYFWRERLNSGMAVLKYDYITYLCLYSRGSEAHYKRGFLMDILGYNDLAVLEYTLAIELNPNNDRYYNNRGSLYMLEGRPHRAVLDFTRAIEINPARAEPYYNRGRALEKMGKYDDARRDYEKAVELGICDKLPSLKICR